MKRGFSPVFLAPRYFIGFLFFERSTKNTHGYYKAFIGGYEIDIDPTAQTVKVDGGGVRVNDRVEYFHIREAKEIFK